MNKVSGNINKFLITFDELNKKVTLLTAKVSQGKQQQ